MSRSDLMARLRRLARASLRDGEGEAGAPGNQSRRRFTQGVIGAAAGAAAWSLSPVAFAALGTRERILRVDTRTQVAVVGAGIAGLTCANELVRLGLQASVFEAGERVGGRCASLRGVFPGQVVERGAEFIGGSHMAMIGYAQALGLELEDASRLPGDTYFQFGGNRYTEAQVAREYREFAQAIQGDLARVGAPSADRFSAGEEALDLLSIDEYLDQRGAGRLLRQFVASAYLAEYGASIHELSALGFLRFVHGNARSKLSPFGGDDGTRLRVVGGNDQIATGLAANLLKPVEFGHRLVSVRRLVSGKVRLVFDVAGTTVQRDVHAAVLALPFSVLRDVEMHSSLSMPSWKSLAINASAVGSHARIAVGFDTPYWYTRHGLNGTGYTDLQRVQATWEAHAGTAGSDAAVLAAHVGGDAALALGQQGVQADANAFLAQLEQVMPGATAAASRDAGGNLRAHVESWSHNPLAKGSFTCNRPGYFTTLAGNEAKPLGNLLFAGDHTSSFYEWQGFMEGAALSGLRAAAEVHALARA